MSLPLELPQLNVEEICVLTYAEEAVNRLVAGKSHVVSQVLRALLSLALSLSLLLLLLIWQEDGHTVMMALACLWASNQTIHPSCLFACFLFLSLLLFLLVLVWFKDILWVPMNATKCC